MATNQINNNSPNQGVGLYKIMQEQNKLILGEAALMITLGKLMNALNSAISADTLALEKVTGNLNMLSNFDLKEKLQNHPQLVSDIETAEKALPKLGELALLSTFGLGALGAMAIVPEEEEEASILKPVKAVGRNSSDTVYNKLGLGKKSVKLWVKGIEGANVAGIIISCLQAYFSTSTGIDNSKIQEIKAYSDGEQEDVKLVSSSESKSSQTIQSITRAEQKEIQDVYKSKTPQIYYNNK